ncbi:MAG: zinc-ribbon domain-containing protein [Chloroflexi bacterium]|nr:zinc-ribbon domain-containing protein [Chloroflexota bacterium]
MPLIQCPDCGKEVSDNAPACPNCGKPFSTVKIEEKKALVTRREGGKYEAWGFFLIVIGIFCFFGKGIYVPIGFILGLVGFIVFLIGRFK